MKTPKPTRPPRPRLYTITWSVVLAVVVITTVAVNAVLFGQLRTVMDNYFRPTVSRSEAVTRASSDLTERIEAEGIVLLKNQDGALPLETGDRKVNVFGWSATNPVYGGTGSGAVDASSATNFLQGLTDAGIEYNTRITDFYTEFRDKRPNIQIRAQDWTVPEPSMAEYDAAGIFESAKDYSDTALVFIARSGGEGADLSRSLGGAKDSIEKQSLPDGRTVDVGAVGSEYEDDIDPSKHYLELSNRERAMVERVSQEFHRVIVVLNTGNIFEMGWIDELGIDAAAWIGGPGETGFKAVDNMLTGAVNPSGRTVDTWVRDLLATPTVHNFGANHYTGSESVDPGDAPISYTEDPATREGYQFLNYAEGIYLGYRFYETYYSGDQAGYDQVVQFPFGYGLSYTEFTQQMGDVRVNGADLAVDVVVTNTGPAAGKEVVQLYSDPPYSDGGIEKASTNLIVFDKTDVLEPGASQTLTLAFPVERLASFDDKSASAYVLDSGDYRLSIRSDAHTTIDERVWNQVDPIVYEGADKRSDDLIPATTRFEGSEGETVTLSRAGGFANYADSIKQAEDREMTDAEKAAVGVSLPEDPSAAMPTTGAKNNMRLTDMVGRDYDDPQWELLLDQLSVDDMVELTTLAGYQTKRIDSVGKPATIDIDGPQGLSSFMGASVKAGAYPTGVVTASTWNVDLALERGEMVGTEALELGVHGWYAPGMNMHRSPFGGRNFEYYSEDPALSAAMAAAETKGTTSKGLYVYIKHFALNEQETYRNSRLTTWVSEQALREIYLRPFESSVKEGGASAVMSSYNYIGGVWAGGHPALLNTVLREEWGFKGMVLSDYFGDYGYMNGTQAVANGGDAMLSTLGMFGATPRSQTPTEVLNLRRASKNVLYTVANSSAMYTDEQRAQMLAPSGGHVSELSGFNRLAYNLGLQSWQLLTYIIDALVVIVVGGLAVRMLRKRRSKIEALAALDSPGTGPGDDGAED